MKTVFLDLDGTLTDPAKGLLASINHTLSEMGRPQMQPSEMGWMIGPALVETFARLGIEDTETALGHYRARYTDTGMYENTVYPGIPEALADLREAGYACVLMTAKPHVYAKKITAHFGLNSYMTAEYGPELDGTRNNKADLLAHAIAELGTDPGRAVMVGDRVYDIEAGRANGMATIAARWGYGQPGEHEAAGAIIENPGQLPSEVERLIGGNT